MDEGEDIKELAIKMKKDIPKQKYGRCIQMIVESIKHNLDLWND